MIELIAEISTNHGGSVPLAKEFIKRFADAGADWLKFQYTRVKHLRPDDPQHAWFEQSELQDDQFAELKAETEAAGAKFLLTVFNAADVPAVAKLSTEAIKIGSGEQKDTPLIAAILEQSTGAVFLSGNGPDVLPVRMNDLNATLARIVWFKCLSWYPTPHAVAMHKALRLSPGGGWSDHAIGIEPCQLAIVNGARLIEKHVQLPNQARPCKPFEATVEEFKALRAFADQHPDRFLNRWQHA